MHDRKEITSPIGQLKLVLHTNFVFGILSKSSYPISIIMRLSVCNRHIVHSLLFVLTIACLFLTATVRVDANRHQAAHYRALMTIQEGEQLIRTGEHLLSKRPSPLTPNEDLKDDHARGQKMVQEGRQKISQGQAQIAKIQELVRKEEEEQRKAIIPSEIVSQRIDKLEIEDAFRDMLNYLTEELPSSIPQRIFFVGTFYNNQGSYSRFDSLNEWFDTRIRNNAENGSKVSLLPDMQWIVNEKHPLGAFQHERLDSFRGSQSAALVSMEILNWNDYPWLVASISATQIESWKLLAHKVWLIQKDSTAAKIFGLTEVETEDNQPVQVKVDDRISFLKSYGKNHTHRLDSERQSPYVPELQFWQTLAKLSLLQDNIRLSHYDWVKRAYFPAASPQQLADDRSELGIRIVPSPSPVEGSKVESFQLRDNKTIPWGWLRLQTISSEEDQSSNQNGNRE